MVVVVAVLELHQALGGLFINLLGNPSALPPLQEYLFAVSLICF